MYALDILRRVSVVIHQHINNCEKRLNWHDETNNDDQFRKEQMQKFSEENFIPKKHVFKKKSTKGGSTRNKYCFFGIKEKSKDEE